jgi:menaquinone-specific isochorismate synthase
MIENILDQLLSLVGERFRQIPSNHRNGIARFEIKIPEMDLFELFYQSSYKEKYYWKSRDNDFESVGFGNEIKSGEIGMLDDLLQEGFRIFAIYDFDYKTNGKVKYFLPSLEFFRKDDYYLAVNTRGKNTEKIISLIREVFEEKETHAKLPRINFRNDYPDQKGWNEMIDRAVERMKNGEFSKIALSRRSIFEFDEDIPIELIFSRLVEKNPSTFNYCFALSDKCAWMGVSPEKLFSRFGRKLTVDSLAGTRKRGKTKEEDLALEHELMNSEKDLTEHNMVKDFIVSKIASLLHNKIEVSETKVKRLSNVQHLFTKISAGIDEIKDKEILDLLHPTPAVGGLPQENINVMINEYEKISREYYASPIGYLNKIQSEFAVGIRSAYIRDNEIVINSGAGIVSDSQANSEWEEIENKLQFFLRIFDDKLQ